ncbi:MAG: DUF6134 family protein [Pseudomonadota bacterium]
MRALLVGFAALAVLPVAIADAVGDTASVEAELETLPVWEPAGGEVIAFDVLRKGKPFGTHIVSFERAEDGALTVTNDIDLQVKIGPITAYRYRHDSVETWEDGQLVGLTGDTRKEGDDLVISAVAEGEAINVAGTNYTGAVASDVIPSSHWHSGEVFAEAVLSSEGGQLLDIRVENLGVETLTIEDEAVEATRFRLYSDITFDLWYDAEGRWVKCAFEARGQEIRYVLKDLY